MKLYATGLLRYILLLMMFFASLTDASSQKVTLVLSGGGSWGAGHIGVIRALEENDIPIDCIVGTSAGAIVGGLYSIGYSPDEIEELMASPQFQRWAEGIIDDENLFYFQNDVSNASWLKLNLDPAKKISSSLPTNIYASDQIDFEVMRMFSQANAAAGENFDSLFVPYRCIVSDVSHSRAVVMRNGNLGRAVRGSMSIPFVYQPIVVDSILYYDGGIYENFPNKAAIEEFHPDFIIGSKVTRPFRDATLDEPVLQVQHLIQAHQPDTIPFSPSVLILPDIPRKVSMLDFTETKRLADSGYVATLKKIPEIKAHLTRQVSSGEIAEARREFKKKFPEFIVDSVRILGLEASQARKLEDILRTTEKEVSIEKFEQDYFKLFGQGFITSMFPVASYDTLQQAFDVDVEVHKANPLAVRIGGNLSFSTFNVGFAEVRYNPILRFPAHFLVNGYFGQPYSSMMASGRIYFKHPGTWFLQSSIIYNRYSYYNTTAYFFDVQQRSSITDKIVTSNVHAGIPVGNDALFRIGLNYTTLYGFYYMSDLFETSDTLTRTRFSYFNPSVIYELNKLNRKQFANSGTHIRASLSLISGDERKTEEAEEFFMGGDLDSHLWFRATGLYEHYFRIAGHFYGGTHLEFNLSGQPLFSSYISTLSFAHPFQPLPESRILFLPGYRAPSWAAGGLKAIAEITKEIEFRGEAYIFQPYQMIEYDSNSNTPYYGDKFASRNYIFSTTLVWNTMLGPLSVGLNYYSSSNDKLQLSINFGYILFNPGRPD